MGDLTMVKEIVSKRAITNIEARRIVEEKLSQLTDSILVKRALEYLTQTSKCETENIDELKTELMKLGLSEQGAVTLLNIVPKELTELRALLPPIDQKMDLEKLEKALEILSRCE